MGKPLVKLTQGIYTLDLNDQSRYWLSQDFTPPETVITPIFSGIAGDRFDQIESNRSFSFTVAITGRSSGQIDSAVRAIKTMLNRASTQRDPLYLLYNASDTVPDPIWGQFGATLRYEVVHGEVGLADGYMVGVRRSTDVNVQISLTIKPYALGKQQKLCSAMGGVLEDTLGAVDGLSRGLSVPEATTNLHTNPVFGNATYDTNWTTGANLVKDKVTDASFTPFGFAAVKLSTVSTTNNTFTESITLTVDSYRLSYYVIAPNRAALSSSQVQVVYDGIAQTTVFTALGNGLYVIDAVVIGTAAAHTCGIIVKQYATIILTGGQCEAKIYYTPLAHGDLLGCAWTGTAHASSTTRAAARVRISTSGLLGAAPFTARIVWKSGASIASGMTILDARDGTHANALLVEIFATQQFRIALHGGGVASGLIALANTTYVLYAVFNGQTFDLYINGSPLGAITATSLAVMGDYLYFGTNYSAANNANGTLKGAALYDRALSATEIATDYANVTAAIANDGRLDGIPWLWTKDGDDVVDNCNDATRDNWCVVGGIGGTDNARTLYDLTASGFDSELLISLNPIDQWVDPSTYLYSEFSGTADANSSGGAYNAKTIDTTGLAPFTVLTIQDKPNRFAAVQNREIYPLLRVYDVGASQVNYMFKPYSSTGLTQDNQKTLSAAWQITRLNSFVMFNAREIFSQYTNENINMTLIPKRATGSADVRLDYVQFMTRPMLSIGRPFVSVSPSVLIDQLDVTEYLPGSNNRFLIPTPATIGDVLNLEPNKFNTLTINLGETITRTLTFNAVRVTPRWNLL